MKNTLVNFLNKYDIKNATILLGYSGGCDSSALLHLLNSVKIDFSLNIVALHLNHNWRGEESLYEQKFAKKTAKNLGVEFYSEILPIGTRHNEVTARELRYDFFERAAKKFNSNIIFLAHNKNDNIETLFYRIIKGTGPSGLSSIPIQRDNYYRPLLNVSREDIENYVKCNNIAYSNDSSNVDIKYRRNLIRQEIIPPAFKINENFLNAVQNLIMLSSNRNEIISEVLNKIKKEITVNDKILKKDFLKLSNAIKLEFLNDFLKNEVQNRDLKTVKRALEFIANNNDSLLSLNAKLFLRVKDEYFYKYQKPDVAPVDTKLHVDKEGIYQFLNFEIKIKRIKCTDISLNELKNISSKCAYIRLEEPLDYILRTKCQGDIIQPFGMKSTQKLKTFLIKKKIPQVKRGQMPFLAVANEILWGGVSIVSEKLRVLPNDEFCYKICITDKGE